MAVEDAEQQLVPLGLAEDRQLVAQVLAGDAQALQRFCDLYLPRLYRYCHSRLGNDSEVDDVVQVVLTIAARKLDTWRGEARVLTWLISICRHELGRHVAGRQRRRDLLADLDEDLLDAVVNSLAAPAADEPDQDLAQAQTAARVHLVLDQLPERYARALELKYVQGLSSKEIAHDIGLGDEATQSLLARARRAFRELCAVAEGGLA